MRRYKNQNRNESRLTYPTSSLYRIIQRDIRYGSCFCISSFIITSTDNLSTSLSSSRSDLVSDTKINQITIFEAVQNGPRTKFLFGVIHQNRDKQNPKPYFHQIIILWICPVNMQNPLTFYNNLQKFRYVQKTQKNLN